MNNNTNKSELSVPKGISIKPQLYKEAQELADNLGLSFSQLVTIILKREIAKDEDFIIEKEDKQYDKW